MMKFPRSAPAILIASGALLLSATGGAVAAGLVTSSQIKNNTIKSIDVRNGTLQTGDLSGAARAALAGQDGVNGTNGSPGTNGADGAPGLVRGFAHVTGGTTITRQSGGITVTNPGPGIVCVTVPGVDPATTSVVASIDWELSSTALAVQAFIEVNDGACPGTSFGVHTYKRDFSAASGTTRTDSNEPFFILIP